MQRIATFGLILDMAGDVAAFVSDPSGTAFTASLAARVVPVLAAIFHHFRHAITDAADEEMAAFRVETIRR
ncbi:MAG TPA: hypothetical protein VNH11_01980 [Pirellulales bacterium]|nr:hypothetical protein [Pirellulales bacterium]